MSTLTARDLAALAVITNAAYDTAKVVRLDPDHGTHVQGIARSIGNQSGGFILPKEDVRDAYLRVTTEHGLEVFWPVAELVEDFHKHLFARYDWSRSGV